MIEIRHSTPRKSDWTQEAYDEIYQETGLELRDSFYLWLMDVLRPEPGARFLDVSCGQGKLVHFAHRAGLDAFGVDFSAHAVAIARSRWPELGWAVADGEGLPFPGASFDYLSHIGSLEHYLDPEKGAREIARVLRPSGRACILLPNAFGLFGNILHVWRTGDVFDDGQPLQRYATRNQWTRLLQGAGLRIESLVGYSEVERPRTSSDWRDLLHRPLRVVRGVISGILPLNLANHFVFLVSRD